MTEPRTLEMWPRIKLPRFGKHEVRKLLELIAGGEKRLTFEQLREWRELIMFAIKDMRSMYENEETAKDYPVRVYYKQDWEALENALGDDEKMIEALELLRTSIQWE